MSQYNADMSLIDLIHHPDVVIKTGDLDMSLIVKKGVFDMSLNSIFRRQLY